MPNLRGAEGHVIDLHDQVALFIEPRNTMPYRSMKTLREDGDTDQLAILEASADAAEWGANLLAGGVAPYDTALKNRESHRLGRS